MRSKKIARAAVFSLIGVLVLSATATRTHAWDETGHKITAYIAWQRMSPAARERAVKLLLAAPEDSHIAAYYMSYGSQTELTRKRDFFVLMSTWADLIKDKDLQTRNKKYSHSNWHYSDTFWMWQDGKPEVVDNANDSGLALEKTIEFTTFIKAPGTGDPDKAIAIAWLIHIIGDLHQPLHTSAKVTQGNPKGDQGGNLFFLTPKGTPRAAQLNLHLFWDTIIQRTTPNARDECDMTYITPIADDIIKRYPIERLRNSLKLETQASWQKESFDLATGEAYRGVNFWEAPSDKYKAKALKISEERLALAGYRMGETFNLAFDPDQSKTPAAAK